MAVVTPTFLLRNHNEAVVKVMGPTGSTATIDLDTLIGSNQIVDLGVGAPVPTVDIAAVTWTGHFDTVITISRNAKVVMTLPSTGSNFLNFNGQDMPPDNTENTSDIAVSITGGQGEVWLRLRKIAGYRSSIELGEFSIYDDPEQVGQ